MKVFDLGMPGKKASLSLSINAVVVLILAIVMLGLGLGFIRNIFGGATAKIQAGLESVSIRNPADANSPITIDDITMKRTAQKEIEVGLYNKGAADLTNVVLQVTECRDSKNDPVGTAPIIAAPAVPALPPSTGKGLKAIFGWPHDEITNECSSCPPVGNYICTIQANADGALGFETAQFFVRLVS